jgi:uncharacterized tellurite resistance protein B-like protein
MRAYPRNSPPAAARIVALALLADGHLSKAELDLLDRLGAHRELGLERHEMHAVLHTFCEDLLSPMHLTWEQACRLDEDTLARLLEEIDDPRLRLRLLNLCAAVVEADDHIAEGESTMLGAAVRHWQLHESMLVTEREAYA